MSKSSACANIMEWCVRDLLAEVYTVTYHAEMCAQITAMYHSGIGDTR
jgi:hypothetical protein